MASGIRDSPTREQESFNPAHWHWMNWMYAEPRMHKNFKNNSTFVERKTFPSGWSMHFAMILTNLVDIFQRLQSGYSSLWICRNVCAHSPLVIPEGEIIKKHSVWYQNAFTFRAKKKLLKTHQNYLSCLMSSESGRQF